MTRKRDLTAPRKALLGATLLGALGTAAFAATGDPQIKTDDPWYPGELSCSTFDRLFKTEAQAYKRATGHDVSSDEDKALAAWFWRNTHYWHGEEGQRDCYSQKFGGDKNREYWTGLFADGFALCGTTHAQWCAEMDALLGHGRSRVVGVAGHNSFEVYLTGGAYGTGRWALLDHDISTVIYSPDGKRMLSLQEIVPDVKHLADPAYAPAREHGWYVSGLHDDDARGVYTSVNAAEYLAGYAGAPPMVHLRSGESFRRYLNPGLDDGKTFVFWGRNFNADGIPGPMRDRTWVNQPEKMYNSKRGTGAVSGRARYANAVFEYTPNFADGTYKQGVIDEAGDHVTFEFYSPYTIAATPANTGAFGIYDPGSTNGLVLHGKANCPVQISVDQGKTWQDAGAMRDGLDLTDRVKGYCQYFLRLGVGAPALKDAGLSWRTVCQANVSVIPHLHDGENAITYLASGRGLVAAGPILEQAQTHVVDGQMGSKAVTLELTAPRHATPLTVYAAAWQASGSPPAPVSYNIDYSTDGGTSWQPVVKDWKIERREPEPKDFWSQSFTWGQADLKDAAAGKPVRIRFSNDGGKTFRKVEAYLAYEEKDATAANVTFAWKSGNGEVKTATHSYAATAGAEDATWRFNPGEKVQTVWVEVKSK
ncbi:MAG TPA: hypothetical protein VG269_00010 [Tepidisphaeraceae bacterium]|jgi:hypothetical protein|nr:hypothetical protein [Tepidisphaeraceae bacterium]